MSPIIVKKIVENAKKRSDIHVHVAYILAFRKWIDFKKLNPNLALQLMNEINEYATKNSYEAEI